MEGENLGNAQKQNTPWGENSNTGWRIRSMFVFEDMVRILDYILKCNRQSLDSIEHKGSAIMTLTF